MIGSMDSTGGGTAGYGPGGLRPISISAGQPRTVRPRGDVALRGILTLTVVGAALSAAAVLAFIGWIAWQDCFLTCGSEPDPVTGALWVGAAMLTLLAGGWVVARVWRIRPAAVRAWTLLLAGFVAAYLAFAMVATAAQAWSDATCTDIVQVSADYSYPRCSVSTAAWAAAWAAAALPLAGAARRLLRIRRA